MSSESLVTFCFIISLFVISIHSYVLQDYEEEPVIHCKIIDDVCGRKVYNTKRGLYTHLQGGCECPQGTTCVVKRHMAQYNTTDYACDPDQAGKEIFPYEQAIGGR